MTKKVNKNLPPFPVDSELKSIDEYLKEYDKLIENSVKRVAVLSESKDMLKAAKKIDFAELDRENARMCEISIILWYISMKEKGEFDKWKN